MRAETPAMFEPSHEPDDDGLSSDPEAPPEDARAPGRSEPLDPAHLRSQRFILSLFGYDRAEVQAFLSHLADRLEETAPTSIAAPGSAPSFEAVGAEVTRILQTATEAAEEMRERLLGETRRAHADAEEEARAIKESAGTQAEEVVAEAERRAGTLVEEAERRAEDLIREAKEEARRIRAADEKARAELAGLTEMLSGVAEELEAEDDARD